jgi:YD repeat-containing protein
MVSITGHDALGRPLTATSPLGAVTTWTWSGPCLGSLTVSASGRSSTTEFSYDGSGQTTGVAVKAGGVLTRTAATQPAALSHDSSTRAWSSAYFGAEGGA